MPSIIVGTAGHIDHGKSALVRALTGTDPDRLPEEKKRGITIDLGFADLKLDDVRLGFVDVPGHERFVKNMLAGAHGIDVLALVIAADEGVMPQTREHFDICRLLGVREGLVVITKSDLVDQDMLALVEEEANELVAGSFLEHGPIVSVSSRTGAGIDDLKRGLQEIARRIPARSAELVMRLPVDRAFSMKGFGAVVTGTLVSGEITEGNELELLPRGVRVRVRGIQVHGKPVSKAQAGQRTAVNLAGIDVGQLQRGMVLAEPNSLRPTQIIDGAISVLPHASRGLKSRSRVRLHIGAAEVLGRIRVLDLPAEISPGQNAFAQIRLEAPIIAVHNDRFIIRSYSPAETIAGGVVLDPFATKHRGKEIEKTRMKLAQLMSSSPVDKLAALVADTALGGMKVDDLIAATGWKREVILAVSSQAQRESNVVEAGGILLSRENFDRLCKNVLSELASFHKREPLARGMLRETLREKVFAHSLPELFGAVTGKLVSAGQLVSEKDVIRVSTHNIDLSEKDSLLREKLEQIYLSAGVEAPTIEDAMARAGVASSLRLQGRKVLQLLIDDGSIVRIQNEMFMHRRVLDELKRRLLDYAARNEPHRLIDVAAFKELAGVSRKYAIPLLEFFDRERVTRRAGDKRLILQP
jgi:selenocysteine-specific elongation factor